MKSVTPFTVWKQIDEKTLKKAICSLLNGTFKNEGASYYVVYNGQNGVMHFFIHNECGYSTTFDDLVEAYIA